MKAQDFHLGDRYLCPMSNQKSTVSYFDLLTYLSKYKIKAEQKALSLSTCISDVRHK